MIKFICMIASNLIILKIDNMMLRVIFEDPSGRKKAQQQGQQRVGKQVAKPSGPSGRNNGS